MMGGCPQRITLVASRLALTSALAGPRSARVATGRPKPADVSVRSRVLKPSDRLRYSPGSLLLIIGSAASQPDVFAERVMEERGVVLSQAKVRSLLAGRVAEDEIEAKAHELLEAAALKRVQT